MATGVKRDLSQGSAILVFVAEVIEVHVEQDHPRRLIDPSRPITAVAKLIWDALDADDSKVDVKDVSHALGGVEEARLQDDGRGIALREASAWGYWRS